MKHLFITLLTIVFSISANAQNSEENSPIIYIFDASGSMWGQIDKQTKMQIGSSVLANAVTKLSDNQDVGLVVYGHRQEKDCEDVEFVVDVETGTKQQVIRSLNNLKPLGRTPLAYSAIQVIDKLRSLNIKATIILITDGIESCGGNICEVVKAAKEEGIDFRMHIIGFGLKDGETDQLLCAAKEGGGQYYDAKDADQLSEVLEDASSTSVDDPEFNFTVFAVKNGKAVDAHVKAYRKDTNQEVAFSRTYQDTSFIYLPPGIYDLKITPLEGSDVSAILIENVESTNQEIGHQTVSFDAGKIAVNCMNNGEGWDAVVNIYQHGERKNLAGGRTYGKITHYEVNPGVYDVELRPLKIKGDQVGYFIENVEVISNETSSANYNFETGIMEIGAISGGNLIDVVVNVTSINSRKGITGGRTYTSESSNPNRYILLPAAYSVSVKGLRDHKGKEEKFELIVVKGETVSKTVEF